jgi:hypothetical protein
MAQVCHYVMTHTANSLYCAQDIKPKKNNTVLKQVSKNSQIVAKRQSPKSLHKSTISNVSNHVTHLHCQETSVKVH